MFTVYFALHKAIPNLWKQQLSNNQRGNTLLIRPIVGFLKNWKKGTTNIRSIWSKNRPNDTPIGQ